MAVFSKERIKEAVQAALDSKDDSSLNLFAAATVRAAYARGREYGRYEGKAAAGDIEKARKESASQARSKGVVGERKRCLTILKAYGDQPETAAKLMESGIPLDKLLKKPPTTEALAQAVLDAGN
jgi:hypothetical protein